MEKCLSVKMGLSHSGAAFQVSNRDTEHLDCLLRGCSPGEQCYPRTGGLLTFA